MSRILSATPEAMTAAADVLKRNGLVGMPTETVYGLAGNAYSDKAVKAIYAAKGRPAFNPLIVHYAHPPAYDHPHYKALAHAFWPGPLTMIVPRTVDPNVSGEATAGLDTIAVRIPAHKIAQDLLKSLDFPLVAPSANPSGLLSPTTPDHVARGLGDKVDLILAAGACDIGLESTVVDVTTDIPVILRPGAITAEQLSNALGINVQISDNVADIKSPGQLLKHYAPHTPLRLNAIDIQPNEALLAFGSTAFMGIKGGGAVKDLPSEQVLNLSENSDLYEAAHNLFSMLKTLDTQEFSAIAVMNIPNEGIGIAINDRLKRAAQR